MEAPSQQMSWCDSWALISFAEENPLSWLQGPAQQRLQYYVPCLYKHIRSMRCYCRRAAGRAGVVGRSAWTFCDWRCYAGWKYGLNPHAKLLNSPWQRFWIFSLWLFDLGPAGRTKMQSCHRGRICMCQVIPFCWSKSSSGESIR